MSKYIITTGSKYLEIDGYASILAYKHLLKELGYNVSCVSTAIPNESITPLIRDIPLTLDDYEKCEDEKFIILDTSNPEWFDKIVDINKITELIDHHTGFEEYWKEKENVKVQIEFIGSVCTIIYEKYVQHNLTSSLDSNICKLLIAGILDNTLNLKASITTKRDIDAYNSLLKIGNINSNWGKEYFLSCQEIIENSLWETIKLNVKVEHINEFLPNIFGQLLILEKGRILNRKNEIFEVMKSYGEEWMINIICLDDGKSYILSKGENTKRKLEKLFNISFADDIMIINKIMLRKEIMKKAREYKA